MKNSVNKNTIVTLVIFCFINCASSVTHAIDASNVLKIKYEYKAWKIVEFQLPKGILYRLATDSINITETHLTFNFIKGCTASPAVMIKNFKTYNPSMADGSIILQYKVSNKIEGQEIVKTEMADGDTWGFFSFKRLSTDNLLGVNEESRLAIWIPPSGDSKVKRSSNFYFSLEGFNKTYAKAKELCLANQ